MLKLLPERLKEARGTRSQREVAEALGIKQTAYSRYEQGVNTPGAEVIYKICITLNVSADWLLGLSNTNTGIEQAKYNALKEAIKTILDSFS